MNMLDIINAKRLNQVLSDAAIQYWIDGVSTHTIPDYQSSALLMAIVLNGMNSHETAQLTWAMMHSGDVLDLSSIQGIKVDKHSTGGVGDKTSLVLGPLVAALGAKVAKMSGKGLGHTGGTLDKLESIPGFQIVLTEQQFIDQVNSIGLAIIGQSQNLVVADKELYALRDVTATVESVPLIAASIMSKKLAAGSDCILLDVKYGEGAFMHDIESARQLAEAMISIGAEMGKSVRVMITDMNQPLGQAVGNALEVREAIETLQGRGPADFTALCLRAGAILLTQAKLVATEDEGYQACASVISDGRAFAKFKQWIHAQGGNLDTLENLDAFTAAAYHEDILAAHSGSIAHVQALELGICARMLGAGRAVKDAALDYQAGLVVKVKVGDVVKAGDCLIHLQSNTPIPPEALIQARGAIEIVDRPIAPDVLIADVL